jgi:hypothetical protein
VVLVGMLVALAAASAEPRFEVRNAYVEPLGGVWQMGARLELALFEEAEAALRDGVPLTVTLDVEVTTERRFLPDETVATLLQRWQLEYHALSERYLITNLNSGEQQAYATLPAALEALSQVRGLPVLDESLIQKGKRYDFGVRASVEVGGMPDTVKVLMFWREWKRSTEWYRWSVRA